jgi:3-deoxy-D-manno-octulosonate 8-phosphate phosphatase (KDO 8-P phosphatase)
VSAVAQFQPALSRVRLLVLDVDGVLTDGRLYYGAKGEMLKAFHVRDGLGIKQVASAGIEVAIISGRKSSFVTKRARDLGIKHVFQGVTDKLAALDKLVKARGFALDHCACIGDDTPDAPILAAAGLGIAVADAHRDALAAADLVTTLPGGYGAVREVCDWLLGASRARGTPDRRGLRA